MKNKDKSSITAIVLAAGKGVRMKSRLAKVLHALCGMPLIYYPLKILSSIKEVKDTIVVLGFQKDKVKKAVVKEFPGAKFSFQPKLNGSAKAVEASLRKVSKDCGHILVICGDSTMLEPSVLKRIISFHKLQGNDCTVISKEVADPYRLGRIIRDYSGDFLAIREEIDLKSDDQKAIREINTGIYLFKKARLLAQIRRIKINPRKKEFFLTDIIGLFKEADYKVEAFKMDEDSVFFSVNSIKDLIDTEKVVRTYLIERLIDKGVKVLDPATTFLGPKTIIGAESTIYPFTFLENNVRIGNRCSVGPFTHIRPGTVVADNSSIGNFAELVRSKIASFVKMKHVSYLGDTEVGENVNIGGGTIVANFDGKKKHKTVIKKGAFIGSDSVLVAPVKVGKKALTGAGSVVTRDVKDKEIVVGVPARRLRKRRDV